MELGEHGDRALGATERPSRERSDALDERVERCGLPKGVEVAQEREREGPEARRRLDVAERALGAGIALGGVGCMFLAKARDEARKTPLPALEAAYDGGFDEHALPAVRGADRAALPVGARVLALFLGFDLRAAKVTLGKELGDLVVGRDEGARARGWGSLVDPPRHLAEREVLGEPPRREALRGAVEQGEQRAARRARPP